jgi:hypothetical protein
MHRSLTVYLLIISFGTRAQVSVLTHHNDNMRTGANLNETKLDITNVDTLHFGKLCERLVDDEVYAQPLVVSNVNIPGQGTHNVLYIATVNNSIYAYDADERMIVNPYWTVNLTPAGSRPPRALDYAMADACGGDYRDFSGNIGIVSTPVIDTTTNTLYCVSKNLVTLTAEYEQWLHAIDITDGSEKPGSPVKIEASVTGHGQGNVNGVMSFNAFYQNQRSALLLSANTIYITWAGYCDMPPYNGWVLGYNATSLQREVTWCATIDGWAGGIWMSGGGISADDQGNIYACTGNGAVGDSGIVSDVSNRGQSVLKLTRVDSTLHVASYFTPYNFQYLNDWDSDLGTCAVMLIPGTDMAITAGKEGYLYVLDKDSMGGIDTIDHVRQRISLDFVECHSGSVFWHSDNADYIYLWPSRERPLLCYEVDHSTGTLDTTSLTQSTMLNGFIPGGILSLSSNGSQVGTGILWANVSLDWPNIGVPNRPAILRAFDASDITHELWNSQEDAQQDSIRNYAKFVPPTIANGRVYMATFSGKVNMYGIFNPDGIEELTEASSVQVFPNPSTGVYTILLKKESTEYKLTVLNCLGEEIIQQKNLRGGNTYSLSLDSQPDGIYFAKVTSNHGSQIIRLVKTN